MADVVRLGVFTSPVLLSLAHEEGLLDEAGLRVAAHPVASSPAQFRSLAAGELDAVLTSPDNTIAYRYVKDNPLGGPLDLEVVSAVDRGLGLSLAMRPGIRPEDMREGERSFGVDVPNSGFAFLGYALLSRLGLEPGSYVVRTQGSTPRRREALLAGETDSTVLNAGNEILASTAGAATLGGVRDVGPYLGTVLARMRTGGSERAVRRLAGVLTEVARQVVAGEHEDAVLAVAQADLGLDPDEARLHLAVLRDEATGLVPDGLVDLPSIETLVRLRDAYAPAPELASVLAEIERLVPAAALRGH